MLSQRFDVDPGMDSFQVYRALRTVNPSPYMYFLAVRAGGALGGSHNREEIAQKEKRACSANPGAGGLVAGVAGARARAARWSTGRSPERGRAAQREDEDLRLENEMMHDEKERAEHVMLVDLGRNDVGRVSEFGSVKVDRLMFVERYSHVMHIVSSIEGELQAGTDGRRCAARLLPCRHAFSGAPKVRAMEIIEELEPSRRGTYGGAVLYADFSGNLDSCIAIRSLLAQGGKGYVQAGAGIVADSVPELEHEESINKAQAVIRAIERAREL